jgi:DUF4097 and DUF4098 domain-containing protein YvlB
MIIATLTLAVAALAAALPSDTVLTVERGARLDVENWRGEVAVQVWDRDAVRVRTRGDRGGEIGWRGSILRVRSEDNSAGGKATDFTITVPRWMGVRIQGHQIGVTVRGTEGEVTVENVGGNVQVDGGAGRVTVRTIQGSVRIRGARGRVEVWNVNDSVTMEDVAGDIAVETTNGGITMRRIRSGSTRATTVNGAIVYEGAILDSGRYAFSTHNGRITITVPDGSNATVSAATYNGGFRAEFPVRLTGMSRDRHYDFTLGSGSARMELESFNGDITLRRPR